MTAKDRTEFEKDDDLRHNAEVLMKDCRSCSISSTAGVDIDNMTLIHALQVHQIELEMQNEELRRLQAELSVSKSKYQDLYEFAPIGYLTLDGSGKILEANLASAYLLGMERVYLVNNRFQAYLGKNYIQEFNAFCSRVLASGKKQAAEFELNYIVRSREAHLWVLIKAQAMQGDIGQGLQIAVIDITERKRAEEALLKSEEKYRTLFNSTADAIVIHDLEGHFLEVNDQTVKLLGYSRDELLGLTPEDIDSPESVLRVKCRIEEILHKGFSIFESVQKTKDGRLLPSEIHAHLIDYEGKKAILAMWRDISERKQSMKKIESLARFPDENPNPVLRISADGTITYANRGSAPLLEPWGCHVGRELPKDYKNLVLELLGSGRLDKIEVVSGGRIFSLVITPIPELDYVNIYGRDITDRKEAENRIKASLQEKEVLLKEVHHRVKNNLQIISALLYLQSSYLTDEDLIKIFRDSQNRVKSMALVHENLYRSKDLGKGDFHEYINQLVSHLSQSYSDLSGKIGFKVHSENVHLNINTAIPCGMIINEQISNSFKHAFPDGKRGEICIDLSSEDDGFKLVVSDNGIGIKGDLNIKDSKTLGFRLIDALVGQIDGKLSLDTKNGTRCEIHFKEQAESVSCSAVKRMNY